MKNILDALNPQQRDAVMTPEGPILIIAGAGSGKTRTLTHRIAYLISKKRIPSRNILGVTFTNKAAGEMKKRIAHLLGAQSIFSKNMPSIGTFHSICVKILRQDIRSVGYNSSFNIFDGHDQTMLIKKIFKDLALPQQQFSPSALRETISRAKNDLLTPQEFADGASDFYEERAAQIYAQYQKILADNNTLDFDDLILLTIRLFRKYPKILEKYQDLFRYILVDEYQDTNNAQYTLITLLARKHRNLFVIGDDYQSIYAWRNADVRNILHFEKDYPDAKIFTLEQNYRSTQNILDAAYHVIKENSNQRHKKLWTENHGGQKLCLYEARDEEDEAAFVAEKIQQEKRRAQKNYTDFVVLYRTNAQSRMLEEMFLRNTIPYRIVGGMKFYERKEIKDLVAYLRLLNNPTDTLSLERIINEPRRGVGPKTLATWFSYAKQRRMTPLDVGRTLATDASSPLPASKNTMIAKFCIFLSDMQAYKERVPLTDLIEKVYRDSGYERMLKNGTLEGETRHENVQELLSVAQKYDAEGSLALQSFLEEVALHSDTDDIDQKSDAVHLMTLHSAKGLEFPIVFIVGLEEGLIPHSRSIFSQNEMEEERRLLYVGITRAKERVFLLFTQQRLLFGSTQVNAPSRFLENIPKHLVEIKNSTSKTSHSKHYQNQKLKIQKDATAATYDKRRTATFSDGDAVRHESFGEGVVIAQDDTLLTVVFKKAGLKKLAKGIAPLTLM